MTGNASQPKHKTIRLSWFVVQTKTGQEETVTMHLQQKGIETYGPRIEGCRYCGIKKIQTTRSLFPNYLFARCELKNVSQVCWTRGVRKVLWENKDPQPINEALIDSLKSLASNDGLIRRSATYQKDDPVVITAGPFKDLYALFDHWESDKERVCLLLNLLNAQIRVSVPASVVATV